MVFCYDVHPVSQREEMGICSFQGIAVVTRGGEGVDTGDSDSL